MARMKWFGYLLNEQGQPIPAAYIYVYLAGSSDTPATIYTSNSGDDFKQTTSPDADSDSLTPLVTNADGYYEFWLGDTSEDYGYPSSQKFRIAWEKSGIANGYNDYISIFPPKLPVDTTSTDEERDKSISNNLGRLWEEHRLSDFEDNALAEDYTGPPHDLQPVNYNSTDTTFNKLVSNAYAKEWEDTKWVKWEYVDYDNLEAELNRGYFLDASSNDINVYLPSSPNVGDTSIFATVDTSNIITLFSNGENMFGEDQNLQLDLNQSGLTLVYTGPSYGWTIVSEISGVSPLDGDTIEVDYVPSNYTRDETIPEAEDQLDLSAHLKGVDDELGRIRDERYVYETIRIRDVFGGSTPPGTTETISSNNGIVEVRKFSGTTSEEVLVTLESNDNIASADGIQFKAISYVTETTTPSGDGVAFAINGYSIGDGENLDQNRGTEVVTSRTNLTLNQYDRIDSGWSNDLDLTLSDSNTLMLRFERPHDHADDTYEYDIGVAFIKLRYRINITE